nr:HAD family hydrolase [Neobacillus sp. Marseille-Q6967]
MFKYKVIFLDIDGTILRPDDMIEDSTINAIEQVKEKGIEVFLATGRPLHEIHTIADKLKVQSFIGYNGAYAIYKGKDLFQEPMGKETVRRFLSIAHENHHEVVLYTKGKNVFTNIHTPAIKRFMEKFHLYQNEELDHEAVYDVLGMTLINLESDETELYQNEDGIHLSQVHVHGMTHCYDVIRDRVNKGVGIQFVLRHLGIEKDQAIAFGDGMNDKEMLMSVGESFAMGNGHPDLFQYAKHKTTEVTDSGIFNGLKMLGLVK